MKLRLGTRRSALAVGQSEMVADQLRALGHDVELVRIVTEGDVTRRSLTQLQGLGVFAARLREALLTWECDLAVHSMKDLPTAVVPGLTIAAVPPRANHRDVLCARDGLTFDQLPPGSRVGSGSPRRVAQLRALRDDLTYVDLRGNVGTRLARVAPGDLDAVVLAAAGLERLGETDVITDALPIVPAPAQGALAVECRADDVAVCEALSAIDDAATHAAVDAERAVLELLGGGCAAPIGALASDDVLRAVVCALDGSAQVTASAPLGPDAARVVVGQLLDQGANQIADLSASRPSRLSELHDDAHLWGGEVTLAGVRVLVTTSRATLADGLRATGAEVSVVDVQRPVALPDAPTDLPPSDWVVITSPTTPLVMRELGLSPAPEAKLAAVGESTAAVVREVFGRCDLVPPGPAAGAAALLDAWPEGAGSVVIPGSAQSAPTIPDGLRAQGWDVQPIPLYAMQPVALPADVRAAWDAGDFDALVVTAGSAGRALRQLAGWPDAAVVAFGEPTAQALERAGLRVDGVSGQQDATGVARAIAAALSRKA